MCVDKYKNYNTDFDNDFDKSFEVLSTLKNKKRNINSILNEKYKHMLENPDFEQEYWSRTAIGIYEIGHDSKRLAKWLAYYDRSYHENLRFYNMMGSLSIFLNETS